MKQTESPDSPLRELCFDHAAGVLDRAAFHARVRAWLQRRMACSEVLILVCGRELALHTDKLRGAGWYADQPAGGARRLYATLAHNGRLVGVLCCSREAGAPAWTAAEGMSLRRHASTLASQFGGPPCDTTAVEEGVRL